MKTALVTDISERHCPLMSNQQHKLIQLQMWTARVPQQTIIHNRVTDSNYTASMRSDGYELKPGYRQKTSYV